jgi:hypothetical protein
MRVGHSVILVAWVVISYIEMISVAVAVVGVVTVSVVGVVTVSVVGVVKVVGVMEIVVVVSVTVWVCEYKPLNLVQEEE